MNSKSKNVQLHLNLKHFESPVANGLTTREVREFLKIVARENLSSKEIRDRARHGRFEVSYLYGVLLIFPSNEGKSGKFWRWDVILSPKSLANLSV
jgi:hypothetical protein